MLNPNKIVEVNRQIREGLQPFLKTKVNQDTLHRVGQGVTRLLALRAPDAPIHLIDVAVSTHPEDPSNICWTPKNIFTLLLLWGVHRPLFMIEAGTVRQQHVDDRGWTDTYETEDGRFVVEFTGQTYSACVYPNEPLDYFQVDVTLPEVTPLG
jgi:hypothetical protein